VETLSSKRQTVLYKVYMDLRLGVGLAVLALGFSSGPSAHPVKGMPNDVLISSVLAAGDRVLVGTDRGGMWEVSASTGEAAKVEGLPPLAYVGCLAKARGRVFVGTVRSGNLNPYQSSSEGTWVLVSGEHKLRQIQGLPKEASAIRIAEGDGRVLLGTYSHGLWAVRDGQYQAVRVPGPPDKDPVDHMCAADRRMLLSGSNHGIWGLESGQSHAVKVGDGLKDQQHWEDGLYGTLCFARFGHKTLIGTSCFGLWGLADGAGSASKISGVPKGDVVRCIASDGNRAYIGSEAGFYALDMGAKAAREIKGLPKGNGVVCLGQVGSIVYIGTDTNGLWALDKRTSRIECVSASFRASGFSISGGHAIAWGGGLYELGTASASASPVAGLPAKAYVTGVQWSGGRVFVGTMMGLFEYEPKGND